MSSKKPSETATGRASGVRCQLELARMGRTVRRGGEYWDGPRMRSGVESMTLPTNTSPTTGWNMRRRKTTVRGRGRASEGEDEARVRWVVSS